jgi:hypothetical protein
MAECSMVAHEFISTTEILQRVPAHLGAMLALCGGHPLPGLLRDAAPVLGLAGAASIGIVYLWRSHPVGIGTADENEPPAP